MTLIPTPPPAWMRSTSRAALPDVCTIVRTATTATLNTTTGDLDPAASTTVYTGPCRVRPRGSQEEDQLVGDLHQTLSPYVGTLPATASASGVTAGDPNNVLVDDYLTVTTSSDPGMQGRSFQVRHIGWSSWQIDRRVGLDDLEQPKGIEA